MGAFIYRSVTMILSMKIDNNDKTSNWPMLKDMRLARA